MIFRLMPKSVTSNDLVYGVMALSPNLVASGSYYVKVVEDIRNLSATGMLPKTTTF